jgi:hypothetical protein
MSYSESVGGVGNYPFRGEQLRVEPVERVSRIRAYEQGVDDGRGYVPPRSATSGSYSAAPVLRVSLRGDSYSAGNSGSRLEADVNPLYTRHGRLANRGDYSRPSESGSSVSMPSVSVSNLKIW